MEPPHVVHVIDGLGAGGAEQLLCAYAPHLRALGKPVSVLVLSDRNGNPRAHTLREAGIPVRLVPVDKLRRLDQISTFVRALRAERPMLVHAHLEFSSLLSAATRRLHGAPVVATLHTLETPTLANRDGMRRLVMHKALDRCADRVLCLSVAAKTLMRQNGLAHAPIDVIPNGIDIEAFRPAQPATRAAVRRELGLSPDAPVILTVAVLRPAKGIDRLVTALAAVRQHHPDVELLVVGDGPQLAALQRQAAEEGVADCVRFTGFRSDIAAIMGAADVFVLPTLDDAQPTVVMEAMACGVPVIASAVGGIPEMMQDDDAGILVPPNDVVALAEALGALLADPARRQRMSAAARRTAVLRFSLERQAARLNALYDDLIGGARWAA